MTRYEILAMILSSIALLVSMATSIWAISVAKKTDSAEHTTVQAVKMDTAKLIATIRSIMQKAMISGLLPDELRKNGKEQEKQLVFMVGR